MKIEEAFPLCQVQVYREAEKQSVDIYSVALATEGVVVVQAELPGLRYPYPRVGDLIFVESTRPDAVYRMRGRVESVMVGERISITLHPEGEIERLQRRRAVRVHAAFPVRLTPKGPEAATLELLTHDISAGGLCVRCPVELRVEANVRVELNLGSEFGQVSCNARVVRCWPRREGGFDVGIAFLNLKSSEEDRIARALMEVMRQKVRL